MRRQAPRRNRRARRYARTLPWMEYDAYSQTVRAPTATVQKGRGSHLVQLLLQSLMSAQLQSALRLGWLRVITYITS